MWYNIVELIIQASSNFHFIFCFCNLIILFVLIAEGSKPRTHHVAESISASSLSSPVEYNLETSNALLIRGDDNNKGISDDHNMTDQDVGGGGDDDDDDDGEATFEEQGQPSASSIEEGSKEIQMYATLSSVNGNVKATSEDQKQNPEGEGGDDEDDDELRRKIEDFIDKFNKEWREEKLRTDYI